uniref:ABC transporter substrate-binding protein n=1 Tax=uncultured Aquincola sp. TaxID=886556 RepID=UPI0032B294A3
MPSALLKLVTARALRRHLLALAASALMGVAATQPALAQPAPSTVPPGKEPIRIAMIEGLSGPFANAGEAVFRNLLWAVERVNARGGVKLADGAHALELVRLDSKGNTEEALAMLRAALDRRINFVAQGNSSATAAAI